MKTILLLGILFVIVFPFLSVDALPGNGDLVVENIQIIPQYPEIGEPVRITADVYNSGIENTDSFASIVTAAYFVDGDLLDIGNIGNIEPGLRNKVTISSNLIWNAEIGEHTMTVIVDYHDTLSDEDDLPDDNKVEGIFSIKNRDFLNLSLDVSPEYVFNNDPTLLQFVVTCIDSNSNKPVSNKRIILNFNDEIIPLTTGKSGQVFFSQTVNSLQSFEVYASFDGDAEYHPTNSSLTVYSISDDASAMMMKLLDVDNRYTFQDYPFELLIFQDSYDTLIEKITPEDDLLDPNTFLIPLPSGHDYFAEIYLDGHLVFLTEKKQLKENTVVVEDLIVPEPGQVKFKVLDELNRPQNNVTVASWIYTSVTDDQGFTDWIEMLPTTFNSAYVSEITLPNQKTFQSTPFFVFSGEKKTVDIIIQETDSTSNIPDWVRNNAKWWGEGQINDESFIDGMQFLVKEGILQLSLIDDETISTSNIPDWVRNNAKWWGEGQINDESFIDGMQFLVKTGILKIT